MRITDLQPGDILLYRKRTIVGKLIAWWTRSEYCHAAMISFSGNVLEMDIQTYRRMSAIQEHSREPIDVYRTKHEPIIRQSVSAEMESIICTRNYGILRAIIAGFRLTFPHRLRWLFGTDELEGSTHCSGSISEAYRKTIGKDLCPSIPDWQTTPGHLANSPLLWFQGKLVFG